MGFAQIGKEGSESLSANSVSVDFRRFEPVYRPIFESLWVYRNQLKNRFLVASAWQHIFGLRSLQTQKSVPPPCQKPILQVVSIYKDIFYLILSRFWFIIIKMKSCGDSEFYEEIKTEGIKTFVCTLLMAPLALGLKAAKTIFRALGVVVGVAALIPTFGSESKRDFFVERVSALARDLADWVLYPFAFCRFLIRCILSHFRK